MCGEPTKCKARLERVKDLYKWGDITKEDYLKKKQTVLKELNRLAPAESQTQNLERLAHFLTNVAHAWDEASEEQKNKLARTIFQEIWIIDDHVVAIKPQPEREPFFQLDCEEFVNKKFESATPRGFEPLISTVTGCHVVFPDHRPNRHRPTRR